MSTFSILTHILKQMDKVNTRSRRYTIHETDNDPQNHSTNNWLTVPTSSNCEGKWIEKPYHYGIDAQILRNPSQLQNFSDKQTHQ